MTRPRPKYTPEPRVLNAFQVACRLGWSEATFSARRPELKAKGFPDHNPFLGGYDAVAVEDWLDLQFGRAKHGAVVNPWDEAVGNGERQNAVR